MTSTPSSSLHQVEGAIEDLDHPDALLRGQAVDRLAELEFPGKIDRLRPKLADPDWVVRFKSACALAWAGDDAGGPLLVEALSQRDLCFLALQALAELGSAEAVEGLQAFFQRRFLHPLERLQAAAALVRSGRAEASAYIEGKLERGLPEERGFALELWGRLRMPGALDRLQAVLADPGNAHRLDAVRGLAQLGDPRAVPLLDQVAQEPGDPELASEAAAALDGLSAGEP